MAAAAGAPGSGEGGEAEPDSEPICGADRPRQEHTEASTLHCSVVQELGRENALDSKEAEYGETGLRLPDTEKQPECITPEVTNWESEVERAPVALEAAPEAWPHRRDIEAEGVEPSVVDTGDKGMVGDVLSSQQEEQPMQLGKDLHCPPVPCHGESAPEAMDLVQMEEVKSEVTPTKAEHPPESAHFICASSPQPLLMSEQLQCASEPVLLEVQGPDLPEEAEVLQESFPEKFALICDSPILEPPHVQEAATPDQLQVSAPLEPILISNMSPVQECSTMEVANEQDPSSPSKMETDVVEVDHVHDPVPEVFLQVQEPTVMEVLDPEGLITLLIEDLPNEGQDSIPEMVISEPEVVLNLQDKIPHKVDEETVPETEEVPRSVQILVHSVQEPCRADFDLVDDKPVPEPFHEEVQVQAEDKVERVHDLEVVENDKGAHSESMQCTEVEVKLFLQPALVKLDDGQESQDIHVSLEKECQPDMSPGQASVQLIMSDSVPEDIHSLSERALENAISPVDSGISSELNSVEKELASQSSHMETEPNVENGSECTKLVSYVQDVEYDPFYRDPKVEDPSNAEAIVEEEHDSSTASTEIVQTKDLGMEEPVLPTTKADVDACIDNPNPCQDPLSAAERLFAGGIDQLIPGSEVQVTLDHIIQDALVVSFRHGDRIFSGVLMDLSKRFGPHGIPVTVHPKREYKNKPEEPIQPQSTSFQEEESLKNKNGTGPMDITPIQSTEPCGVNKTLWMSKPPPLFHEGAPYPPPLFIRDTYNQSIPQPPPRKIKRLKKKIYREEPTSIMNAIKLRPRQVLCDKCKNVVADKREVRKTGNDSFKLEEGKRRRHESVTTVNKKLKTDHKVNGKSQSESQKKNPVSKVSNHGHGRGKVVKVASQTNASKAQLHPKKVLQSKNMDHAKAREVLKMAKEKAQKKQKNSSSSKNAHSKVHFTRRLQNTTSGTLPPRLRIKPQRYRNEENNASLKIGLESLRSSKIGIKPQTRYTATRSAGEAPSEIKTPSNGPEEVSTTVENASVCVPPGEQDEQQALSKQGSKSNITVYMTLNQKKADSSSASVCSSDSTDDIKSTHSECSSTENFDFPPGTMHAPSSSSSSSSKEEKKLSNSLKIKMFSKNVSKCMTPDGRTICVGDIVWAKIYGFPWWPARILNITVSRKDNGLLVRQEASISWFGSPTTSFLALSQLSPFLENFQSRFNKKRKGLYRKAITEAAKAAKQLTPEVRALLTQFET
ncbi:PWWP domain-containing protein 2A [Bufo gargarizans]|uniref:PWWP domain-containing protein 2A n=1 Tax=Bufo gargarizans TaxID=30331 RepID=UPI001CF32F21|nr:PWWP domain-containing protein 2A [Bufo gargarizans]XP_044137199.1 PWWP domain-containing protein 2A [Bufo gargarizans]